MRAECVRYPGILSLILLFLSFCVSAESKLFFFMYAPSYSHARLYLTDVRYILSTSVFHECAICESRYVRSIGSLSFQCSTMLLNIVCTVTCLAEQKTKRAALAFIRINSVSLRQFLYFFSFPQLLRCSYSIQPEPTCPSEVSFFFAFENTEKPDYLNWYQVLQYKITRKARVITCSGNQREKLGKGCGVTKCTNGTLKFSEQAKLKDERFFSHIRMLPFYNVIIPRLATRKCLNMKNKMRENVCATTPL